MRGKVAVLESRLGQQLVELIAQRGGKPVHAPALEELPDLDSAKIAELIESLEEAPAKLFVFQTGVGTKALFAAADGLGVTEKLLKSLSASKVAVRGPKPAGPLRQRGVRIDFSAAEPYTTQEVLQSLEGLPLAGARVIVQRYGSVNTGLDRALEAAGASVSEIPTYRWSLPKNTAPLENLVHALERGEIRAAVFTNAEQVRNLVAISRKISKEEKLKTALNRAGTVVASIGPVASAALREAGVKVGLEAKPPKLGALLAALDAALP